MNQIHIGIGDYAVSGDQSQSIKTFALGSCVAIIVYDKTRHIAGMMHVALPESSINRQKADSKPGYFVDTGLPILLSEMKKKNVTRANLWIKLVGGSNIMDEKRRFDIGKRNVLAIKKMLWKKQLGTIAEDVGGDISRTVCIDVGTGAVTVSNSKGSWSL